MTLNIVLNVISVCCGLAIDVAKQKAKYFENFVLKNYFFPKN